jgi:hypothetical protein
VRHRLWHLERRVLAEELNSLETIPVLANCTVKVRMEVLVRLSDEVVDALDALAEETGRSPAELIAEALRDYLSEAGTATPRSFGMYSDAELSAAEAEDWPRAN